jgi:hypothetical protein
VRRFCKRFPVAVAFLATAAALGLVVTTPAVADRSATKAERAAVKRVVLKRCGTTPEPCEFRKARVSTRNARYVWASVVQEGLSGMLLKRPSARSRRFKVIGIQGGGIGECSYWRARAPSAVLRDLDIAGVVDDTGAARNCG